MSNVLGSTNQHLALITGVVVKTGLESPEATTEAIEDFDRFPGIFSITC